ncbi:hypothetical protein Tco_0718927 [Tanacetum coccineum]
MMRQLPPEPSRQEAFEDLAMNYILDQEEKVMQLKEYMGVIRSDSMQLSLEVVGKLKGEIRMEENRAKKIEKITMYPDIEELEPLNNHKISKTLTKKFDSFVCNGYDPYACAVFHSESYEENKDQCPTFWSLLELGWRVGLYSEEQSRLASTRSGLRRGEAIKVEHVLMGFWPTIGDGEFVVGGMAVKKVRDLRIRLAYRCITTTISGGMFITRIARYLGLLTNAMVDALSVKPRAHVFKKKYFLAMGIMMELGRGMCCWPVTRQVGEDDEVEEAANEGVGGSADVYRNMSRGDWQVRQGQWMDQQGGR